MRIYLILTYGLMVNSRLVFNLSKLWVFRKE